MDYRKLGSRFERVAVGAVFGAILLWLVVVLVNHGIAREQCRRSCVAQGATSWTYAGSRYQEPVCTCGARPGASGAETG